LRFFYWNIEYSDFLKEALECSYFAQLKVYWRPEFRLWWKRKFNIVFLQRKFNIFGLTKNILRERLFSFWAFCNLNECKYVIQENFLSTPTIIPIPLQIKIISNFILFIISLHPHKKYSNTYNKFPVVKIANRYTL
jgi:hypothetical protein